MGTPSGASGGGYVPNGSALLNFALSDCRSRLGSDWTNLKVYTRDQPSSFPPWFRARVAYVLTRNGVDDIVRGGSQQLGDDGELVDVILSGKQRLTLQHLGKDAAGTPDVYLDVILLPGEHDLGRSVVSRGDVAGHLGILDTGQTEIADLEVAVLVDEDVAGLEIAVDDAGRVDILETPLW